ncbi:MAG: hypothetical protein ACI8XZ_005468, partial [Gammaproteobacteria bacterium]
RIAGVRLWEVPRNINLRMMRKIASTEAMGYGESLGLISRLLISSNRRVRSRLKLGRVRVFPSASGEIYVDGSATSRYALVSIDR